MKSNAERLLNEVHPTLSEISELSVWKDMGREHLNVFSYVTTSDLEERELDAGDGVRVVVTRYERDDLLEYIPDELGRTTKLRIEPPHIESGSDTITTDVRVTRRSSEEMSEWGSKFPALCFEHWPKGLSGNQWDSENFSELIKVLSDQYGLRLDVHPERIGNQLIVIEDPRATVYLQESSEDGIIEQLHDDPSIPQEEPLLDLADSWVVDLQQVKKEDIEIVIRTEEYGDLLYESVVDVSSGNAISDSEAAELARGRNLNSVIAVDDGTETVRYPVPEYSAPGGSEQFCLVKKGGLTLDKASVPLVRGVGLNMNIGGKGTDSEPEIPVPTRIFEESDHKVGPPIWQERITNFGPTIATNTWVIESDDDYEEVIDELYSRFTSTVKIMDPYLQPDDLSSFVEQASPDAEFWILIGHKPKYMDSTRAGFEECVSKAKEKEISLAIRWVPGNHSTPIHDRFVLSPEGGLSVGTSFNSLDSNLSMMYELRDEDSRSLEDNFDTWYSNMDFAEEYDVETIAATNN